MRSKAALRGVTCVAALLAGTLPYVGSAETFTVTSTANAGAGSLREAMTMANATEGADVIVFDLLPGSTITTDATLPDVAEALTIDGSAVAGLQIQGFDPAMDLLVASADLTLRDVGFFDGRLSLGGSPVVLDSAGSVAIGGGFSGSLGTLRKTGSGTVTLAGSASFSPLGTVEVRIEEGTLAVDGVLLAPGVVVGVGGTLAGIQSAPGNGIVIGPVDVAGRVAPSTSSGTLRVGSGPIVFASGSVLEIDVLPGDAGDLLRVEQGSLQVQAGASLEIRADVDAIRASMASTQVTLVEADGGIMGSFSEVTDFAFLEETLDQDATSITITLQDNGQTLSTLAVTPNQRSVAATLEALGSPTPDLADALLALNQSTAAELPRALDAIGGEPLTAFATARQMLGERTARALHRRVRDAAWGESQPAWAATLDAPGPVFAGGLGAAPLGFRALAPVAARPRDPLAPDPEPPGPVRAGAWLDAYGVLGELDGGLGEAEIDANLYGGTLGVDLWLAEHFVVGLAAGYARGDLDADGREHDLDADVIQGAVYAGYAHPRGFLSAYGRYAYGFLDSTRRIQTSALVRSADADWTSHDYGAGAEAGVTLFRAGPVGFQPMAGIDWLHLGEEDYTESGAGGLSLDVSPDDLESTTARFGGRLVARFAMDDEGSELVPELRAFWQTELGDRERVLNARLLGAGTGGAIRVEGAELPQSVLLVGLGWSAQISPRLQVLADYDALLDSDRVEHQATLAFRFRF